MNRFLFILSLFLLCTQVFSQHSSRAYYKLADSLYQYHHYQYAADYYQRALHKADDPAGIMVKIARSYVKFNQDDDAEKWFIQALSNGATLSLNDYFLYAEALITLKKRSQAERLLEGIVQQDPNAHLARRALNDLQDFQRFYKDSADYIVDSLSINTPESEFAAVYYQDGIVFTAAWEEGMFRKKSQWDNSDFLKLYLAVKTGPNSFDHPVIFDRQLNTQYHDGPAAFYAHFQKMIINRNQSILMPGTEDIYELRPGLYDAEFDQKKSLWYVKPMPFNNSEYSYAHPSISEDGNTLYFVSNKPGGFGGMDIYRVVKANGAWGEPYNLGPAVNTAENEAFPFFIDNTLYFASNGHGGLGGLDIFVSTKTLNGFTPPVNLGYPINTTTDDFSLVTDMSQRRGYFSSARKGNDDLFSFEKVAGKIKISAHIFDSLTQESLDSARIDIVTNSGNDILLNANEVGNFDFELPEDIAFVVIGTKDNKIGMAADIADQPKTELIPALGDTSRLACIGLIQNEQGFPRKASIISVMNEQTGDRVDHPGDRSIVSFMGEKGQSYKVDIENEQGTKATHQVVIEADDDSTKTWIMVLPDVQKEMLMAARIFRADNDQPLANADVSIVTFGEADQLLTADADGLVDFTIPEGMSYVIIGSKDDFSGMTSGIAEKGQGKESMIQPVPCYSDLPNPVIAMGRVTNRRGVPIDDYTAQVTNKVNGEILPTQTKQGVLTFQGQHGQAYNIEVSHDGYETRLQELILPETGPDLEKFIVILDEKSTAVEKILPVAASVAVVDNIKSGKSDLLVFDTEEGTSKIYIKSGETLSEITERDSVLYHQTDRGSEYLGLGNLSDLRTNPSDVLSGLEKSDLTKLRNIYFEFDKAALDEKDFVYLHYLRDLLAHDRSLTLLIAGHADDRGSDSYNIKLSARRAQAVSRFLMKEGIQKERILIKAYGESLPVVPCYDADCSEEDYQKNRRAEFVVSHGFKNRVPAVD